MTSFSQSQFGFELSTRIVNCLINMGCEKVEDILKYSEADFLRQPNFGLKSFKQLRETLAAHGYYLNDGLYVEDPYKTKEGKELFSDYWIAKLKWEIYRDKIKLNGYRK